MENYSNKSLLPETRKSSNKQPDFTPKAIREQAKPKVSRRKEIINIRAEISEREMKKTVEKINETKSGSLKRSTKLIYP